ncbi:SlyX family protein [Candidatus Williamhamiltonella defendens]|uniref:SlyX family protein n=1 Tax=Candidatus Williamhamiltonella defendens TaxID=138072 RepID=UPI001F44FEF5|nr:SlyX family protein [Candidatus Hamiltonella defensa]
MTDELTQRLEILESCLSFQEVAIEDLNKAMVEHKIKIIHLQETIRVLNAKLTLALLSHLAPLSEEDPPPHY